MEAYIYDAVRTPRGRGKSDGSLHDITPIQLATQMLEAVRDRNDIDTADVDDVIWGTSAQVNEQGGDLGRMSALDAGYDITASGVTLDRFCGSGITSANLAAANWLPRPPLSLRSPSPFPCLSLPLPLCRMTPWRRKRQKSC